MLALYETKTTYSVILPNLLTSELEKHTRKPDGWNSPQIAYSELQINPQSEAISLLLHPQPHINNAKWRDYLKSSSLCNIKSNSSTKEK